MTRTELSLVTLLNAGTLFPDKDRSAESMFGEVDKVVEVDEGLFTLHWRNSFEKGGHDVLFFDTNSGGFGRVTFKQDGLGNNQWKNTGPPREDSPESRLDSVTAAVEFAAQLTVLLQGQEWKNEALTQLRPHITHIIQSAYEWPGSYKADIDRQAARLSSIMPVEVP